MINIYFFRFNILIIVALLFACSTGFAQQSIEKPSYYFGNKGETISKEEFAQKAMSFGYDYKYKEMDTAFVGRLILKREKGTLTKEQLVEVRKYLKKLTGKNINTNSTIVINYFVAPKDGDKTCADSYVNDSDYAKRLQQLDLTEQFFIAEKRYQLEKKNVYQESADFLKHYLFENARTCGNYMILRPDGSFYSKYGEYEQDKIISLIDVTWDINK
ncbi:hypothetical protein LX97_02634 [Nonlabens dokdonensis]|uniref:Uncharacterized protein n=2 Tax=Nonlabens dokdonensis TaxID=328515 RepID=L7WHW9_NONDD|nr:hypothetical protein [Nonlabens dokdonensis]AGC78603.1 hypothetical protein DDD_3476 [Nonlabens dokdonensis DSW-6]PZX39268.1 hypothetical protein LX97_02634 [Nonlabens dokdonensis]